MGGCFGGFGGAGWGQTPMPAPQKIDISETGLKHCGYKKGTQNTASVDGYKMVNEGHNRLSVTGKDGKKFTIDTAVCKGQIEIHADGNKGKKAIIKIKLKDLKNGGTITLPNGAKINLKSDGKSLTKVQIQSTSGQTATIDNPSKGNPSWKSGGDAIKTTGPQLNANAGMDKITKGPAPTPGQIAKGNSDHLKPMGNFMQQQMPGMSQSPQPRMQQAAQMMKMMMTMMNLMNQMAQMFTMANGSRFGMIR